MSNKVNAPEYLYVLLRRPTDGLQSEAIRMLLLDLKQSDAMEFLYNKIPIDKTPLFKSTYTFQIASGNGDLKNILHQRIALQVVDNGEIQHLLSLYSDITFPNTLPEDCISFMGVNGEIFYVAISTDTNNFVQSKTEFDISARERDVIKLLSDGLSSKQIATKLYISQHTVDTHRRNLLKKTKTKNSLELTTLCLKKGLI